jgi:hypothetical protein
MVSINKQSGMQPRATGGTGGKSEAHLWQFSLRIFCAMLVEQRVLAAQKTLRDLPSFLAKTPRDFFDIISASNAFGGLGWAGLGWGSVREARGDGVPRGASGRLGAPLAACLVGIFEAMGSVSKRWGD